MMRILFCTVVLISYAAGVFAQQGESVYGDKAKADVKLVYVYSLEDAFSQSAKTGKPVFFNCFADWAVPCHAMNQLVFSDQEFCDFMNANFVNLFMDLSKNENRDIAKHYDVISFAQFLVLDSEGNVLLRIKGGKEKDDFKKAVMLALNPKTTLPGAEKEYRGGKCGKKEMLNYLRVLELADEEEKFKEVNSAYFSKLKPKEYAKEENWVCFSNEVKDRNHPGFAYLVEHKDEFVKNNGAKKVNLFIEGLYYWEVFDYLMGKKSFDPIEMASFYSGMQKAGLPEESTLFLIYRMAQLRGKNDIKGLLATMRENEDKLDQLKYYIDTSFVFPDADEETKGLLAQYFKDAAEKWGDNMYGHQMAEMATALYGNNKGIEFLPLSFDKALEESLKTGKPVFIDCYTSWCGPCKKLAKTVFTDDEVAGLFNSSFINLKIDMEKGEGPELAKRFGVEAYPTLLFLDGKGNVIRKNRGAPSKEKLIGIARAVVD